MNIAKYDYVRRFDIPFWNLKQTSVPSDYPNDSADAGNTNSDEENDWISR